MFLIKKKIIITTKKKKGIANRNSLFLPFLKSKTYPTNGRKIKVNPTIAIMAKLINLKIVSIISIYLKQYFLRKQSVFSSYFYYINSF